VLCGKIETGGEEMSPEMIAGQVEKIVQYAAEDDKRRKAAVAASGRGRRTGLYFSYPQLAAAALIVCAMGLAPVFITTNDRVADLALQDFGQVQHTYGRRTVGWVSAFKDHADWSEGSRGGEGNNSEAAVAGAKVELAVSNAVSKLKSADNDNAPTADRLALAQIRLASGSLEGARKALNVLEPLSHKLTNQKALAEVYNDIGVAQLQLRQTADALNSFNQALAASPNMQQAIFNRGLAFRQEGRFAEMKQSLDEFS